MWHPDEGTIHAWIEGQLPSEEARRVESHVEKCGECQAAVREARGVIAGASRVVGFLDEAIGAGTAALDGAARRRRTTATVWTAIAATVVIAVGSMFVVRGKPGVETARDQLLKQESRAPLADTPIPQMQTQAAAPFVDTMRTRRRPSAPERAGGGASHAPVTNMPTLFQPTVDTGAQKSAADKATAEAAQPALAAGAVAPRPAPAAAAGVAGANRAEPRASAPQLRSTVLTGANVGQARGGAVDLMAPASLIGCYQLTPTVESQTVKFGVLPRAFALFTVAIDSVSPPRRVVGAVVGGRTVEIPELTWMAQGNGFLVAGGNAGSLIASVRSGAATAMDSSGNQQLAIARARCP